MVDVYDEMLNASLGSRNGLWVGRVEDIDDPLRMNRVRVRVFHIHGSCEQTATSALPWAEIGDIGGGGPDYGSAGAMYPIGSTVWVMFEMGNEEYPVVVMGRRKGNIQRDSLNPVEFRTVGGTETSATERTWQPAEGINELPTDIFADSSLADPHPTRTVWHKSFKGHTILVEDRDGHEFFKIIDRAGQTIEMFCPVTEAANANNAAQRGSRNAADNNQLPQSDLVSSQGWIRLIDVAGQEIVLDGKDGNEQIRLVSRNRSGSSIQKLILSSQKGREKITFTDKAGNFFTLDPNSPISITLQDYTGNKLEFDSENGAVAQTSTNNNIETVKNSKTLSVSGKLSETIGGDRVTKILGNEFLDILTSAAISVQGQTTVVLSGPLDMQLVNAGGTPVGNAGKITATIGKVSLSTLAGNSEIASTLGMVLSDPSTIKIGSSMAAEPLVLGNQLVTALNNLVTTVFVANAATFGVSPVGPVSLNPAVIAALQGWAGSLSGLINSLRRFTEK